MCEKSNFHFQICPKCHKYHIPCICCAEGQIRRESGIDLLSCYNPSDFLTIGENESQFNIDLSDLEFEQERQWYLNQDL